MDKIFEQAKDLHVRSVIVYGKAEDHKLYWNFANSAYSDQLEEAELQELFKKGLLLIDDAGVLLLAVKVDGEKATTVSYASNTVGCVEWSAIAAE